MPQQRFRLVWWFAVPLLTGFGCSPKAAPDPYAQACTDIDCGPGRCVLDGDRPACLCDEGYRPEGLACVVREVVPPDLCEPNPCQLLHRTVCTIAAGVAHCGCEPGTFEHAGNCLLQNPCLPNPCTQANQTQCSISGTAAQCGCDPGYAPEGDGCSFDKVFDCASQHSGGDSDAFEPDECPILARELPTTGAALGGHTLAPAGDSDWFRVQPAPGHIYQVSALAGAALPLYLDLYDADAVTTRSFDHRGSPSVQARFKALTTEPIYVRVRAFRGNDTGAFAISAEDLGLDDFADSAAAANPVTVGAFVNGELQFPGDVDAFAVVLTAGNAYSISLAPGVAGLTLELVGPDRTTVLRTSQASPPAIVTLSKATATYGVRVSAGATGNQGTFALRLQDLGPDDHGDALPEASPIVPRTTSAGASFERSGDLDWFSFTATAGHVYGFTCTLQGGYSGCTTQFLDASGSVIASNSSSYTSYLAYEFATGGTYYVRASAQYGNSAYAYRLEDLGADDHGDAPSAASAIAVGQSATGRIETPGDLDVFSFSTVAGHVYRFSCTPGTGLSGCNARILNAAGVTLSSGSSSYGAAATAYKAVQSGTLYAEAAGTSSYSGQVGSYTFALQDLGVDDHGDTRGDATAITPSASAVAASFEASGDSDVFSFSGTAPDIYRFTCTAPGYGSCAAQLLNAAGAVLATSNSSPAIVGYELSVSGTYFVQLTSSSSASGVAYTYKLENLGPDDHGDDPASATALTPSGNSLSGSLETPSDVDVFSFAASAGHIYRFSCTPSGYSAACSAVLKNAAGLTVASGGSYSGGSTLSYEVPSAGTYTIAVSSGYSWQPGSYVYKLEDLGLDDHGDTIATATDLAVPTSATSGVIEASIDLDVFGFDAIADQIYRFTCTGGTLSTCGLRLKDAAGAVLATGSGYQSNGVGYKAKASGRLYIEVYGYYSGSSGTYTYQLEDLGTDDHGDTASAATPLSAPGLFTAGRLEYAEDVDYFSIDLTAGNHQAFAAGGSVYVGVLASDGVTLLAYDTYSPRAFTAATAGKYYVRVKYPYASSVQQYSVSVQ